MYNCSVENRYNEMVEENHVYKSNKRPRDTQLEKIEILSEDLAKDIIEYKIHDVQKPLNSTAAIMRRTVDEMSGKHKILLNSMASKLNITKETCTIAFEKVVDEMFDDHQINWGRIIAMYSFVVLLAKSCNDQSMADVLPLFPLIVKRYVARNLSEWILDNGGWDAYEEKFSDSRDTEKNIFKSLLITGLGLTVLAGYIAVR